MPADVRPARRRPDAARRSARRKGSRCSTARRSRRRSRSPASSRRSACSRRRSSPARSRPTRRRARTVRSTRASRRCAAIAGQIEVAAALRALMAGSAIRASHLDERRPRAGPLLPALPAAGDGRRARPAAPGRRRRSPSRPTASPTIRSSSRRPARCISGGNFHAEPVAFAADMIALALCEIGSLAERRIAMLVDPALSGLPAFLTPKPGLNSGFMIPQVTAAALVSENKQRAMPASVDSIPTSANQEDHVSMATHGARRLLADGRERRRTSSRIELLAAAQGCDFHAPLRSSAAARSASRALLRRRRAAARGRPLHGRPTSRPRRGSSRRARSSRRAGTSLPARRGGGADDRAPHEFLDDSVARRGAAGRQPAAYRHRRSRPRSRRASSRPGSRARTPTGGSSGSTTSPATSARRSCAPTLSRTVIDVNRDPSGASLYPGPGDDGALPDRRPSTASRSTGRARAGRGGDRGAARVLLRPVSRARSPARSRGCATAHARVVLYDCHSIRSVIPRLFDGELPHFNIGTNGGASCDPALAAARRGVCAATRLQPVSRTAASRAATSPATTGGPGDGVHAVQMELACRGYMRRAARRRARRPGRRLTTRPAPRRCAAALARLLRSRARLAAKTVEDPQDRP